jgi:hypothetical protein
VNGYIQIEHYCSNDWVKGNASHGRHRICVAAGVEYLHIFLRTLFANRDAQHYFFCLYAAGEGKKQTLKCMCHQQPEVNGGA